MKVKFGRTMSACLAVVVVGFLAGGCDWNQLGFASGHTGDNAGETVITPGNVSTLVEHFSASDGTGGEVTPQAVVNGVLYTSDAAGLDAYSANGTTGCAGSPATCAPLWSYSTGAIDGNVVVLYGVVFASTSSGLDAFDASGQTNCSGTPLVCQPLWTAPGAYGSPTVSGGTVFVTSSSGLEAFDAAGQANCSGSPKVCAPIWTSPVAGAAPVATVSGGIAYVIRDDGITGSTIVALDATGSRGCGGSPKVCTPLWTYAPTYDRIEDSYVVVSGTTLYVDTFSGQTEPPTLTGDLEAFDASGVDRCSGTPAVCAPIWSSSNSPSVASPVAGDGAVFEPMLFGPGYSFAAYNASGPNGSDPLWESSVAAEPEALGGSVLFAGNGTTVYAFDAGGSAGCTGSICSPLWSTSGTDAIIANGTLYVGTANSGAVAYGLPS